MTSREVRLAAHRCGFLLAGVAAAGPNRDGARYQSWVERGFGGRMGYLAGHRAGARSDPRNLLPSARSIVSVGKLYNTREPYSVEVTDPERAWISRYAWGEDYHASMRRDLEHLVAWMLEREAFEYRICVDTTPLLERSYARDAGLGWIGHNTCLINQWAGSLFFLGELLLSLELEPDAPAANRCGSCTRCVDACPTRAIIPSPDGGFELDARLCISYLTIELKGAIPGPQRAGIGRHVFGCDICQDVCPWNRRAAISLEPGFHGSAAPTLDTLATMAPSDFRDAFGSTPVERTKYRGFLRNVAVAMGNSRSARFREHLERMADLPDETVASHARDALARLG